MEIFDDIEALFDHVNPERTYKVNPRINYSDFYSDKEFYDRFRLSKQSTNLLFNEIKLHLERTTMRNIDRAVPPINQLLLTLRFLATGGFYIAVGDFGGIHKSTAGNIINKVLTAICNLRNSYIKLPRTVEEMQETSSAFYQIAKFPRVVGALDCTHVKLQSLGSEKAEIFRNRKGYFSLNVQAICHSKNRFLDLICRWPGSSHDSHIFNNSAVRTYFENGDMKNFILLGDSGYPLRRYLLTPIANPQEEAEMLYNESQIRTRNVIERTFGIWKRRFPILSVEIRTKLDLVQKIIISCAILHNIACSQNEEVFEGENDDDQIEIIAGQEENDNIEINARADMIAFFRDMLNQGMQ